MSGCSLVYSHPWPAPVTLAATRTVHRVTEGNCRTSKIAIACHELIPTRLIGFCKFDRYQHARQAGSKPQSTGDLGAFWARERERCPLNWDDGSSLRFRHLVREDTSQVRLSHSPGRTRASFDDPNLVSHGGLVPVMALAERAGLPGLIEEHVRPGGECGVNAPLKVGCLVAGMAAGADSIDDMGLLRHGAMDVLFGGVRAPSTLGSHLRCYTWGNVLQLEKAGPGAAGPAVPPGSAAARRGRAGLRRHRLDAEAGLRAQARKAPGSATRRSRASPCWSGA